MFYVLIVVLVVVAAFWMTRPLWSSGLTQAQQRQTANVTAYRRRLSEIDADVEAGLLDGETAGSLKNELDARLVREASQASGPVEQAGKNLPLSILLVAMMLIAATLGYASLGSWKLQDKIANAVPGAPVEHDTGSLEVMAGRLEARLEANPQDIEGWILLGRSRVMLDDFPKAANAFHQANQLSGQSNPDWMVDEGEALAMSRERVMLGRPRKLFESALKIDPTHQKGLWYTGLAALQADQPELAVRYWTRLSEQDLEPAVRDSLGKELAELRKVVKADDRTPSSAVANSQAAEKPVTESQSAGLSIRVNVDVDPAVRDRIDPSAVLFVFAKAASGPPMPLAVYRGLASELPTSVTLDDSMAMMPALKLSQFDAWTLSARVSRSGQPQAGSGDIQGSLTVERSDLGDAALALTLDEVVP